MKLTDYMADFLSKEVKHVFNGQGGVVIHILDSIASNPNITLVPCENEQGASLAAEAYARVNKNLGVAIATRGPGMINLMQGIACAYYDSIPTLFIAGASHRGHLKGDLNVRQLGFQEMEVVSIVKSLTKYAVLITDPKKIRYELEKLVYMAKEGRPGSVLLDLPDDIQREEINPESLSPFIPEKKTDINFDKELTEFKKLLEKAERPVVVVGSGVKLSKTEDLVKRFIKKNNLPAATTWATIDLFLDNDPNLVGNFGISASRSGNFAVQTADLIISFGSRLDTHETGSNPLKFAPNAKKIMVDIDNAELNRKNINIDLKINVDLRIFLKELLTLSIKKNNYTNWKNKIKTWNKN